MPILDFVFPKTCLSCGKEGNYICQSCLTQVPVLSPVCPYCERWSVGGLTHTKCMKEYGLDGLTSIWDYDGAVRKAILALKFKYSTETGKELCDLFVEFLTKISRSPTNPTLVPIPLHWHRENVRGFNQSKEMGKQIAQKMGWKYLPDLLIKKKSTNSQVELSVDERKRNLINVFSISNNIVLPQNLNVVLFDDVFTTGSTLKEAAKVLKQVGIGKVWGLTIAR